MVEFKHYKAYAEKMGADLTMASGPVIIVDGKVLLDKHGEDKFWKFPGGKMSDDETAQETAIREAKEELGLDVTLGGKPVAMIVEREEGEGKQYIVLFHYKADYAGQIKPGRDVREWAWHDVNNLPKDCAENIKPVVEAFLKNL